MTLIVLAIIGTLTLALFVAVAFVVLEISRDQKARADVESQPRSRARVGS